MLETIHPLPEMPTVEAQQAMGGFRPLEKINTIAATPKEHSFENVHAAMKRSHVRLHELPEFKVPKGEAKIALIGGGPSVRGFVEELKNFDGITVACGSSHDWCVENGIIPDMCVVCDPDPITANYVQKPHKNTTFLIATQCDPFVFDALKDHNIVMWHCYNEDYEGFKKVDPEFQAVGGGCTVGLRSLSIAMLLGYKNIHFYGFDSCLGENREHHAYSFSDDSEELGSLYCVKTNHSGERSYLVAGYQMAQAQHFKDFYEFYNEYFTPTFHGDGLLPDMCRSIQKEAERLKTEMETEEKHVCND